MTNAEKRIMQEYKEECQTAALTADDNVRRIQWSAKLAAIRELHRRLYNEQRRRENNRKPIDPNRFPNEPDYPSILNGVPMTRETDPTAA